MRSIFLWRWIRANEQGNTGLGGPTTCAHIEPLEHRQLLSVASLVHDATVPALVATRSTSGQNHNHHSNNNDNNSSAFPNMLGTYKGRVIVRRAVGVSPGSKLRMVLRFNQETVGGQLAGRMSIRGVGTADVTGTITRRDVNLSFVSNTGGSLNGTLTGTVSRDGQDFSGKIFAQIRNTAVRGNFVMEKTRNAPFVLSNNLTGVTSTAVNNNNVNPAFLNAQSNGFVTPTTVGTMLPTPGAGMSSNINFSSGAGIGSGVNFSGGSPFVVQPTPTVTPIGGVFPTTTDLLASSTFPSAGSTLQTPISAGSVLTTPIGTPGTLSSVNSGLFSTTPIGSSMFA